ncbi:MAG: hypothetical protein ABI222_15995 [Opitutaceae bacterium]
MTKDQTLRLTGCSAALYLLLCWAFADHQFSGDWWNSHAIAEANVFTSAVLVVIVLAGLSQVLRAPVSAVQPAATPVAANDQIDTPVVWKLVMGNADSAIAWKPIRFVVGQG